MNASCGRLRPYALLTSSVPNSAYQAATARASSGVSAHGQYSSRSAGNRYSAAAPISITLPNTAETARRTLSLGSAAGVGSFP